MNATISYFLSSRLYTGSKGEVVELGGKGSRSLDGRVLRVGVDKARDASGRESEQSRDVAVRRGRAVAASAGAVGLCDGGAGALAGREAAAALLAFAVGRARLGDRLLALLARGKRRHGLASSRRGGWC